MDRWMIMYMYIDRQRNRQIDRPKYIYADRQMDRQTDRQTDEQVI